MGYHIYAWLEDGQPRLRIYDAITGCLSVGWDYLPNHFSKEQTQPQPEELKQLFRQLLLLTCQQDCRNVRMYGVDGLQRMFHSVAIKSMPPPDSVLNNDCEKKA